jgi:hypothetical protein
MDFLKKLFANGNASDNCNKQKIVDSLNGVFGSGSKTDSKEINSKAPGDYKIFTPLSRNCFVSEPGFYNGNTFRGNFQFIENENKLKGLDRVNTRYDSMLYSGPCNICGPWNECKCNKANPEECSPFGVSSSRDQYCGRFAELNNRFTAPSGCGSFGSSRATIGVNSREIAKKDCSVKHYSSTF